MAWTTLTKTDSQHDTGKPVTKDLFIDPVIDNLNDLDGRIGTAGSKGVLNASFEEGTVGASNAPSNWTWTASGSGGTYALTSTSGEQQHGQNGFKITHPSGVGNGGGYIQTDDFIPVGTSDFLYVAWKMKVSAANGAQNKVTVLWYKPDQTASATTSTDIFDDTAGPTAWTQCFSGALVPSDASFYKLRLLGGDTATDPGSSTDIFFDDVRIVNGPADVYGASMEFTDQSKSAAVVLASAQIIWVECWGGGGGSDTSSLCRGAGGGEYAAGYFFGAATTEYAVSLGAGGTTGGNGGNTTFNSTTVVATGGGGSTNGAGNNGDGGTGGTGLITIDGQDGEDADQGYGGYCARGGGNSPGASSTDGHYPGGGAAGKNSDANAGGDGKCVVWFN